MSNFNASANLFFCSFLVASMAYNVDVLLVFNKIDLLDDDENQMLDNEPELVIKALEDTLMDARADRLTISLRYAVDIKGSEEGEIMYFRNADLILFLDKVNLQILHKDSATFVNSQNTESFEIKEAKLNALYISIYTKDGRECFLTDDSGPVAIATNKSDGEEHIIMEMLRKDNSFIELNRKRITLKI